MTVSVPVSKSHDVNRRLSSQDSPHLQVWTEPSPEYWNDLNYIPLYTQLSPVYSLGLALKPFVFMYHVYKLKLKP